MPDATVPPDECQNMAEVREGVDSIDAEILSLLARRLAYMRAAARIKTERSQVRDEVRKAEVTANAKAIARDLSIPVDLVEELWERLVEGSIAYELEAWDRAAASDP